jgi:hypothetical protein
MRNGIRCAVPHTIRNVSTVTITCVNVLTDQRDLQPVHIQTVLHFKIFTAMEQSEFFLWNAFHFLLLKNEEYAKPVYL